MQTDRAGADLAKAPSTRFVCNESDSETRSDYHECAGDYGLYSCTQAHCHARKELAPQEWVRGPSDAQSLRGVAKAKGLISNIEDCLYNCSYSSTVPLPHKQLLPAAVRIRQGTLPRRNVTCHVFSRKANPKFLAYDEKNIFDQKARFQNTGACIWEIQAPAYRAPYLENTRGCIWKIRAPV